MTIKNIKETYKKKKRNAKAAFLAEKRKIKNEYVVEKQNYFSKQQTSAIDPPKRGLLEEIGNSVTHGVGAIFSVVAYLLMLFASDDAADIVAASIYFFGLFVAFTMSCLYHAFRHGSAVKRLFRRFDYSSIYLLIGATFAPLLLCYVKGVYGITFLIAQWSVIATGITLIGIFGPTRFRPLHMALYVLLGWSALIFLPTMIAKDINFFFLILAGGIVYSLGIIPFAIKAKCSHFIWHFFVLAGAVVQWLGIYLYLYL